MDLRWRRERMLLWGKTYPELSLKRTETVCTGAVFLDRPGLIRIYPIDFRYLREEQRPKKYSIITAEIAKTPSDPRPESYKIRAETIVVEKTLGTEDGWTARRQYMLQAEHMVSGLEEMEAMQRESKRSLGIIKPDEIIDVSLAKVPPADMEAFEQKYKTIVSQRELWPVGEKPVPMPRYKPRITFRCAADSKPYNRVILDWEVIEGAKHHFGESDPSSSFRDWIMKVAFSPEHDPYLILGNISTHPQEFVVVCVMYPKKQDQGSLFW